MSACGDTGVGTPSRGAAPAQYFTLRVDFLKQDQTGKGMPRSLATPTGPDEFSWAQAIEEYARAANLSEESPP